MPGVSRAELHCFRCQLAKPMETVFGRVESRPALIVRIVDDEGAEGFGEIWCNFPQPGAEYRARLAAAILPQALAGLSAESYATAFKTIRARLHRLALQAGEPGPADQIASGLDIALHDLAARRRGVPLAAILGAAPRSLPAYASGIDSRLAAGMIDDARAAGYGAFKIRIGFGRDSDIRAMSAAINAMKPGELLFADANQNWDRAEAVHMAEVLADAGLGWLEEPLPVDSPSADWRAVAAAASRMPIAGGENMRSRSEFADAVAGDVFGIIQPDICKWGGLSACAEVARQVITSNKRYCPHYLGGGIGLVASAHLLAAVGGDGLLEVDVNDNALRELLAGPLLPLVGGRVHVPTGPGLGYVPNFAAVADMRTLHLSVTVATA